MAKCENPIRGYITCPVCQSPATVHQCGEGKLMSTGEPPKNSRNIGLLYYRCPECGNSSISKSGNEFVSKHMVESLTELNALEAAPPLAKEPTLATETEEALTDEQTESKPLAFSVTAKDATNERTDVTESSTKLRLNNRLINRLLLLTITVIFIFVCARQATQKQPKQEGDAHVTVR